MNVRRLHDMNIRHLQNGIGTASVVGIVVIVVLVALGTGSPSKAPQLVSASVPMTPFPIGDNAPLFGTPSKPPSAIAPPTSATCLCVCSRI